MLRTKDMCTPRPRCTPAHDRQMKMPNLGDAHCGLGAPQSQQTLLEDSFWIARSYAARLRLALKDWTVYRPVVEDQILSVCMDKGHTS
jgi:hypothetical protein